VTTAKIVDANVTLAKLSATGTKDATTFLRGDNTFAYQVLYILILLINLVEQQFLEMQLI
jgi:hypothetical protein